MPRVTSASAMRSSMGGKAAALLEMQEAGFKVPEFQVSPADVSQAVACLGTPLAVRSSASLEDDPHHSFAGQFSSFLNLETVEQVREAIRKCHDSLHSDSVARYCRRHHLDPDSLHMDVVLQRMLQPELAGVAFSVNPMTGGDGVVVEACEGTADELLAGRKQALSQNDSLLRQHLPEIEELVRRLQSHFGSPQDVEFAVERGTLYVLQSRPITSINFPAKIGHWTNAIFRDGGVSHGVCSPLMWSLYDSVWETALKGFLREIGLLKGDFQAGRMFFQRPYWNSEAVKQCLLKLPGFVEREFDADVSVCPNYDGPGRQTPVSWWQVLRSYPSLLSIDRAVRRQPRKAREILAIDRQGLEQKFDACQPVSAHRRLTELIDNEYRLIETTYFRTIFVTCLAKLEFTSTFADLNDTALLSSLPELTLMRCMRELQEAREAGDLPLEPFLAAVSHQCIEGLDVMLPRWGEAAKLINRLAECDPASHRIHTAERYQQARRDALGRLKPRQRRAFQLKLDRLRDFLWLREELRDLSSRVYYLIRKLALRLGEERGLGEDIFMLTYSEIGTDDRSRISERRRMLEGYRNFQAPNEIAAKSPTLAPQTIDGLQGIGVSPGTARGPAYLARTLKQALGMPPGSVLVCPFIEPGWVPVLGRAIGVVTESGGMLSHAAVICREFGLPAVLSIEQATSRIPHNCELQICGDGGGVEILT